MTIVSSIVDRFSIRGRNHRWKAKKLTDPTMLSNITFLSSALLLGIIRYVLMLYNVVSCRYSPNSIKALGLHQFCRRTFLLFQIWSAFSEIELSHTGVLNMLRNCSQATENTQIKMHYINEIIIPLK